MLILASESPRRQQLLAGAGFDFRTAPADLDEEAHAPAGALPAQVALHLARAKALHVAKQYPTDVVLAADTVVAFGDVAMSKAADPNAARRMVGLLEGTTQIVITGLAVRRIDPPVELSRTVMSAVRMRRMATAEIDAYVASDRWRGKAGGYGIQDPEPIVTLVGGSLTNVIGLPVEEAVELLGKAGVMRTI